MNLSPRKLDALRSVWVHTRKPFKGGSQGWELDERMAHNAAMSRKWNRLEMGPRGWLLFHLFLDNWLAQKSQKT
jgi:hypothetical protein